VAPGFPCPTMPRWRRRSPVGRACPRVVSSLEPWREQITAWHNAGIQGTSIHAALVRNHGYTGSYSSVHRFVPAGRDRPGGFRGGSLAHRHPLRRDHQDLVLRDDPVLVAPPVCRTGAGSEHRHLAGLPSPCLWACFSLVKWVAQAPERDRIRGLSEAMASRWCALEAGGLLSSISGGLWRPHRTSRLIGPVEGNRQAAGFLIAYRRGVNGRSSSWSGRTIPTLDSGTSFQTSDTSPSGSETTIRLSSERPWMRSSCGNLALTASTLSL
jgi:hypothetical protein